MPGTLVRHQNKGAAGSGGSCPKECPAVGWISLCHILHITHVFSSLIVGGCFFVGEFTIAPVGGRFAEAKLCKKISAFLPISR